MGVLNRLDQAADSAFRIHFSDTDRIVLFSDCHRGDNSWSDDFSHNQNLMYYALQHYYDHGFTYIELGDGDELFENPSFSTIRNAHAHIFSQMQRFFMDGRLHLIYGNHDITRKTPAVVSRDFHEPIEGLQGVWEPLFPGINVHEGIMLVHEPTGGSIFLVHGHQGDFVNDIMWPIGLMVTRYIWRNLQLIGIRNPISPAESVHKQRRVENRLIRWATTRGQVLVCGHTHRPRLPMPGGENYFNTGSCVFPRSITGIEISDGFVTLVQWMVRPQFSKDNALRIIRHEMSKPQAVKDYFPGDHSPDISSCGFLPLEKNGW